MSKYKRFSMTVRVKEFLPHPSEPDFEVLKNNFPKWFQKDWLHEGLSEQIVKEVLEDERHNTGLFRISGNWAIIGLYDDDCEFDTNNLKVVRICKRKK